MVLTPVREYPVFVAMTDVSKFVTYGGAFGRVPPWSYTEALLLPACIAPALIPRFRKVVDCRGFISSYSLPEMCVL